MKFELVSAQADNEGTFNLQMLAIGSDMEHYALNTLKHLPEVGESFPIEISWPAQKDGLVSATQEDYEKYGTRSASGIFRRIA